MENYTQMTPRELNEKLNELLNERALSLNKIKVATATYEGSISINPNPVLETIDSPLRDQTTEYQKFFNPQLTSTEKLEVLKNIERVSKRLQYLETELVKIANLLVEN